MNRTTAIQIKPAEVTEDRVLQKPAVFKVYVPKTHFNHRGIKWLDDSQARRER